MSGCPELMLSPARAAIVRSLQWVASGGFSLSVRFTTCLIFLAVNGLRPGGRVDQVKDHPSFGAHHEIEVTQANVEFDNHDIPSRPRQCGPERGD
jgi:hypothetical protein